MARTGSQLPPQIRSQPTGTPGVRGEAAKSTPRDAGGRPQQTAQPAKAAGDQFSLKSLNLVVKQMKEGLTRQTSKPFDPSQLVRSKGIQAVATEELRQEMRQAAKAGKASDLSEFDQVFLEYFMGKRTLGALLQAGEKKYRQKKLEEWREFLEMLYAYTKEKKAHPKQIRELIFRGLSNQDPRPNVGAHGPSTLRQSSGQAGSGRAVVLIGDLYFKRKRRDRCEKFVRFEIPNDDVLGKLRSIEPGAVIDVKTLTNFFGAGELSYLAIYYRPVRQGLLTAQGHPLAKSMDQQAQAAARAREAMLSKGMGVSSQATSHAEEQVKGKKKEKKAEGSEDLYKQKSLLDKLLS